MSIKQQLSFLHLHTEALNLFQTTLLNQWTKKKVYNIYPMCLRLTRKQGCLPAVIDWMLAVHICCLLFWLQSLRFLLWTHNWFSPAWGGGFHQMLQVASCSWPQIYIGFLWCSRLACACPGAKGQSMEPSSSYWVFCMETGGMWCTTQQAHKQH